MRGRALAVGLGLTLAACGGGEELSASGDDASVELDTFCRDRRDLGGQFSLGDSGVEIDPLDVDDFADDVTAAATIIENYIIESGDGAVYDANGDVRGETIRLDDEGMHINPGSTMRDGEVLIPYEDDGVTLAKVDTSYVYCAIPGGFGGLNALETTQFAQFVVRIGGELPEAGS